MIPIPLWSLFPFVTLLLAIALLPILTPHFWESNRNKAIGTLLVSLPILAFLLYQDPHAIGHTLTEYFSFICLLGSLFVISGGIAVTGDLEATPRVNSLFLALGAVLANFIGTTGASMVLIRPLLRTNSERKKTSHIPIFFIFIVANCGGLLTPLGDPPLFLGYLRGVPFFWTLQLFPIWLLMNGLLLLIFYFVDSRAYRHETKKDIARDRAEIQPIRVQGKMNLLFLAGVLFAVFLDTPWREGLMILMAALSLFLGSKKARQTNRFQWGPIVEVAILFAGIFITMVPALHYLKEAAPRFGILKPWQFFWSTGALSSFLDNAPTYLTFLSLAQGLNLPADLVGVPALILQAISAGAVCMGANTYIGNGPNFMVKAIADHAGFKTPSFFGYMIWSAIILLPLFGMVHVIFFNP